MAKLRYWVIVRNVGDIKSEFYWQKHGFQSLVQLQSGDSEHHEFVFVSYWFQIFLATHTVDELMTLFLPFHRSLSFFLSHYIYFFKVDSNLTHLITVRLVARGTSQEPQLSCLITIFINFVSAHLSLFWAWRGSKKMSPWRVFNTSLIVKVNKTDYVSSSVLR